MLLNAELLKLVTYISPMAKASRTNAAPSADNKIQVRLWLRTDFTSERDCGDDDDGRKDDVKENRRMRQHEMPVLRR